MHATAVLDAYLNSDAYLNCSEGDEVNLIRGNSCTVCWVRFLAVRFSKEITKVPGLVPRRL